MAGGSGGGSQQAFYHGISNYRTFRSFFLNESLHYELRERALACLAASDPGDPRTSRFPHVLHHYHSFVALEPLFSVQLHSKVFNCQTEVYKATSQIDGLPYCVRRVDFSRTNLDFAKQALESWSAVASHPNVVSWRDVFSSKVFSGTSNTYFVYDYHPCSTTLQARYFDSQSRGFEPMDEPTLWSFILQILSALRAIHRAGLACRGLRPCQILLTGRNRFRINSLGIADSIAIERPKHLGRYQHEDLLSLGKMILSLAINVDEGAAVLDLPRNMHLLESACSPDLANLVRILLKPPSPKSPTPDDLMAMLAPRLVDQVDSLFVHSDFLETELSKEMENGRLFRIAAKLGFINERPEFEHDPSWSETGNRYLLKLFRDYTFHQVNPDRTPNIDYGHVVETLNKLDLASPEKIVLSARDSQSFLVVSYKDLHRCLNQAFQELLNPKQAPSSS